MTFDLDHFSRYIEALWGVRPFPWQARLAARVLAGAGYPRQLHLPTGSGKTSIIDVHLYVLAQQAAAGEDRRVPLRLFFTVDRRAVVDQTAERTRHLIDRLTRARGGLLAEVAEALRGLWQGPPSSPPVGGALLRGGIVRDRSWARRPDCPMVVSTTVDQIGSRLLFRGYGLSPAMAPIHAGLVGEDALIVLDEVHLSQPFLETLDAIQRGHRPAGKVVPRRWQVVALSATPRQRPGAGHVFTLDDADHRDPVLGRRLYALKPARLVPTAAVGSDRAKDRAAICRAAVDETVALVERGHRAVALILNRVDLARSAWRRLRTRRELVRRRATVELVTGRMRPLDRERSRKALDALRASRRPEEDPDPPVVVVGTQCLEVGADLDLDGLVTQAASLAALRQRFGRLNRMGRFGTPFDRNERQRPLTAEGVILCPADQSGADPDPIYGEAIRTTMDVLRKLATGEKGVVSFEIVHMDQALEGLTEPARDQLLGPRPSAPILLPTYMKLWSQTRPRPWPDPDVAPFLHGPRHAPDVQLIWRCDVTDSELEQARSERPDVARDALEGLIGRVEALPPVATEALALPLYAVRRWLAGARPATVADVPVETATTTRRATSPGRLALRWAGEASRVVSAGEIRPGETLILPACRGGLNEAGVWDPTADAVVSDLAERAQWATRGRAVLRVERFGELIPTEWTGAVMARVEGDEEAAFESRAEERAAIRAWLAAVSSHVEAAPWLRDAARHLMRTGWTCLVLPRSGGEAGEVPRIVLVGRRPREGERDFFPDAADHTGGAAGAAPVTLRHHCAAVAATVRGIARRLGLPETLAQDLALAGRLHDLGKADPRFQRLLAAGDPVRAAMAGEPLAKSTLSPADRSARHRARERSRYPLDGRHELLSLVLAEAAGDLSTVADPDLVAHLILSHHGWCRPVAPPVVDPEPVMVSHPWKTGVRVSSRHDLARIDAGVAARFERLNERYGRHTLAWLEALLRLADHEVSAGRSADQEGDRGGSA